MNKLFEQYGPQNPYKNMVKEYQDFAKSFTGTPQENIQNIQGRIQQMLNSGKITQQQYNAAVQKANMIKSFFGM